MEERINIHVTNPETQVIEILNGNSLPKKEPKILAIEGNIDSPRRVLNIRWKNLDQQSCHILVDRNPRQPFIKLVIDEANHYSGSIKGTVQYNPEFVKFGINQKKSFTLRDLSDFIKMNRYYFADSDVAMRLVAELRNFKAKVSKEMEKVSDNRGNAKILIDQVVDSNVPESFVLVIPIFKGGKSVAFKVEINISVRDADMDCQLESVEANDYIIDHCTKVIDEELNQIGLIAPEIVQIEI